jgi:hypothetical protein
VLPRVERLIDVDVMAMGCRSDASMRMITRQR